LAVAASAVRFFAVVRARRAVVFDGDLAPVAALLRAVVERLAAVVERLAAVVERFAAVVERFLAAVVDRFFAVVERFGVVDVVAVVVVEVLVSVAIC
jgi:hypothetical protein